MIRRHRFNLTVAKAGVTVGDTGRLTGKVEQLRWYPDVTDTGQVGTIQLAVLTDEDDTGAGFLFYNHAVANFGVGFKARPPLASTDTGATFVDTVVGAGDGLRAKLIGADTGIAFSGRLYVWSKE